MQYDNLENIPIVLGFVLICLYIYIFYLLQDDYLHNYIGKGLWFKQHQLCETNHFLWGGTVLFSLYNQQCVIWLDYVTTFIYTLLHNTYAPMWFYVWVNFKSWVKTENITSFGLNMDRGISLAKKGWHPWNMNCLMILTS